MVNRYETVFIVTPVLSEEQMKETVEKYTNFLNWPILFAKRTPDSTTSSSLALRVASLPTLRWPTSATSVCSAS